MPRPCKTCSHPDRQRIELMLAGGLSYEVVSRETRSPEVSPDSLSRHWENHVLPDMKVQLWSEGVPALALAERVLSMDSDVSTIRKTAMEAGDHATALRAVRTSVSLIPFVMERLGIESTDTQLYLREAQMLFGLISQILQETPRAVTLFTERLPPEGESLKKALQNIAAAANSKEQVEMAETATASG